MLPRPVVRTARHVRQKQHVHAAARRLGLSPMATLASPTVPRLEAPHLDCAHQLGHVGDVAGRLRQSGILKISLGFRDDDSRYLEHLIRSLHHHCGHQLPISHSATRGWFWDVRPRTTAFQTADHQARSETMQQFPWHTDCSYESPPPRYFALQVLRPDGCGGGTLSVMDVARLSELLSPATRASLARPEYRISIPPEFVKHPVRRHMTGSLLVDGMMRFRQDIVTPLSASASSALDELGRALQSVAAQSQSTVHLTPEHLPARSIILVDNRRWLHARNDIRDPDRHLRRVRWDAIPFPGGSACAAP